MLILNNRQKEGLGMCQNLGCVEKHRQSGAGNTFYRAEISDLKIETYVDQIWNKYDTNMDGYLQKSETKRFVQQTFGNFGYNNRFSQ